MKINGWNNYFDLSVKFLRRHLTRRISETVSNSRFVRYFIENIYEKYIQSVHKKATALSVIDCKALCEKCVILCHVLLYTTPQRYAICL